MATATEEYWKDVELKKLTPPIKPDVANECDTANFECARTPHATHPAHRPMPDGRAAEACHACRRGRNGFWYRGAHLRTHAARPAQEISGLSRECGRQIGRKGQPVVCGLLGRGCGTGLHDGAARGASVHCGASVRWNAEWPIIVSAPPAAMRWGPPSHNTPMATAPPSRSYRLGGMRRRANDRRGLSRLVGGAQPRHSAMGVGTIGRGTRRSACETRVRVCDRYARLATCARCYGAALAAQLLRRSSTADDAGWMARAVDLVKAARGAALRLCSVVVTEPTPNPWLCAPRIIGRMQYPYVRALAHIGVHWRLSCVCVRVCACVRNAVCACVRACVRVCLRVCVCCV